MDTMNSSLKSVQNWQLQLRCGLQKFSKFSEKRAKPLSIFFFILLIFGNFDETKQGKA